MGGDPIDYDIKFKLFLVTKLFNPYGGSFVNLMERSKIPIGIFGEGSAERNNLKF